MFVNVPIKKISGLTFGAIVSIFLGYISFISLPDIVVKQIQKVTIAFILILNTLNLNINANNHFTLILYTAHSSRF